MPQGRRPSLPSLPNFGFVRALSPLSGDWIGFVRAFSRPSGDRIGFVRALRCGVGSLDSLPIWQPWLRSRDFARAFLAPIEDDQPETTPAVHIIACAVALRDATTHVQILEWILVQHLASSTLVVFPMDSR
jgi:hypothetical protein